MNTSQTVTVPGTREGVQSGARALDAFVDAHGLPPSARWRFQVALDEVLSNVVRHGGATMIDLLFALDNDVLSLEVTDRGAAFDPLQAAAPDTSAGLDDRRPGGLGIVLVRTLMDAVRYERRGAHNHLTMIWRLRPDDDPAPAVEKGTTNDD